jgi:hypothetical protein
MQKIQYSLIVIVIGLVTTAMAGVTPKPQPYAIFEPALPCDQAQQLAHRVVERLGYVPTPPVPVPDSTASIIKGQREGVFGPEAVTVKITCGTDGVHIDAQSDVPPCEQTNQIVRRTAERLGYTITSFTPAVANGRKGVLTGKQESQHEQDTVTLTIKCDDDAIHVDTHSDNPVVVSTDFTAAITDFRRGFFSLFKPLAAERQQKGTP